MFNSITKTETVCARVRRTLGCDRKSEWGDGKRKPEPKKKINKKKYNAREQRDEDTEVRECGGTPTAKCPPTAARAVWLKRREQMCVLLRCHLKTERGVCTVPWHVCVNYTGN